MQRNVKIVNWKAKKKKIFYNFLQTYLPEKRYSIVDELEKKSVIHRSSDLIESGELLKEAEKDKADKKKSAKSAEDISDFKVKVEKLKIMKEAGLLSDEEFREQRDKLLEEV